MSTTPAGWYPDPNDDRNLRWWDGEGWTARTAPNPDRLPHSPTDSFDDTFNPGSYRDDTVNTTPPRRPRRPMVFAAVAIVAVGVLGYRTLASTAPAGPSITATTPDARVPAPADTPAEDLFATDGLGDTDSDVILGDDDAGEFGSFTEIVGPVFVDSRFVPRTNTLVVAWVEPILPEGTVVTGYKVTVRSGNQTRTVTTDAVMTFAQFKLRGRTGCTLELVTRTTAGDSAPRIVACGVTSGE